MSEREDFADWKNQSNSVNPWLAWQARANLAAECIAELEAREREWQPIETAPRDGSEMLGWSSISGEAYVMWWEAIHSDWVWGINDLEDMFCDPTHWMPLPEPPE